MHEEKGKLEYLSVLIENYCNANVWSKRTPLYAADIPKMQDKIKSESAEEIPVFFYLDEYLTPPYGSAADSKSTHTNSQTENRLLNVVKSLESSLTNDDEDGVRLCAYEVLHRSIDLYFPQGYFAQDDRSNDIFPSLQGILKFLIDRLDDIPCMEKIIECLFLLLVSKDSVIQGDVKGWSESVQGNTKFHGFSLPLPVRLDIDHPREEPRETHVEALDRRITSYPHAAIQQYRWLSVENVASILNGICEKTQMEYMRSTHRRQIYDIFLKYLLAHYEYESLRLSSTQTEIYDREMHTYGSQVMRCLLPNDFLSNFLECFDNERDPRNVLSYLEICRRIIHFASYGEMFSAVGKRVDFFDAFSCFFPLAYEDTGHQTNLTAGSSKSNGQSKGHYEFIPLSPEKKHDANPEAIKKVLHDMLSHEGFYEFSLPFLLDKMDSPLLDTQMDVLDVFSLVYQRGVKIQPYTGNNSTDGTSVLLENADLVSDKVIEAIKIVLAKDKTCYQAFYDMLFQAFLAANHSIRHTERNDSVDRSGPLSAWVELTTALNAEEKEISTNEPTLYAKRAMHFLRMFASWISTFALDAKEFRPVKSIAERVIHELIISTQIYREIRSESPHSKVHSRKTNILVYSSLLLGIGGASAENEMYAVSRISPLICSRMNEIEQEKDSLIGDVNASKHTTNDDHLIALGYESQTLMMVTLALFQLLENFTSKICSRDEDYSAHLHEQLRILTDLIGINHAVEFFCRVFSSTLGHPTEKKAAVECLTHVGHLYFMIYSKAIERVDNAPELLSECTAGIGKIIGILSDMHLKACKEGKWLFLTPILRLAAINSTAREKVFAFVFPLWRDLLLGESESTFAKTALIEAAACFAKLEAANATWKNSAIVGEILELLFEIADPFDIATSTILDILLDLPGAFCDSLAISMPLEKSLMRLGKRNTSSEKVKFLDNPSNECLDFFWIFHLSLKKGITDPEIISAALQVAKDRYSRQFESFVKVLSTVLELGKCTSTKHTAGIIDCYEAVSSEPSCADLCKFLPLVTLRNGHDESWILESYKEFFKLLESALLQLDESATNETRIRTLASICVYFIRWIFYASSEEATNNAEEHLDSFLQMFSRYGKAQKIFWVVISVDGLSEQSSSWKKIVENTDAERRWKTAVIKKSISVLQQEEYVNSLSFAADFQPVIKFMLSLTRLPQKITNIDTILQLLLRAMSLHIIEYGNNTEEIFSIECIGLAILRNTDTMLTQTLVYEFLRLTFVPLCEEYYSLSTPTLVAACLDILILLHARSTKEVLGAIASLPDDLKRLLPKYFFSAQPYAMKDCILHMSQKAMGHDRRYVRSRAQKCRHLYSLVEMT